MKVKEILSNVQLVIAQIEVELNGEIQTSPTLCALIPAEGEEQEKIILVHIDANTNFFVWHVLFV